MHSGQAKLLTTIFPFFLPDPKLQRTFGSRDDVSLAEHFSQNSTVKINHGEQY